MNYTIRLIVRQSLTKLDENVIRYDLGMSAQLENRRF